MTDISAMGHSLNAIYQSQLIRECAFDRVDYMCSKGLLVKGGRPCNDITQMKGSSTTRGGGRQLIGQSRELSKRSDT